MMRRKTGKIFRIWARSLGLWLLVPGLWAGSVVWYDVSSVSATASAAHVGFDVTGYVSLDQEGGSSIKFPWYHAFGGGSFDWIVAGLTGLLDTGVPVTSTFITGPSTLYAVDWDNIQDSAPTSLPLAYQNGTTYTVYYTTKTGVGVTTLPWVPDASSSAALAKSLAEAGVAMGNEIITLLNDKRDTSKDKPNATDFHFTPAFTPNTNTKQRSTWEHVLNALEESGPINFNKEQVRVWMCGYKSGGRVQTLPSNPGYHSSNVGALMGTEYRSLKDKWTVGLLLGTVVGKQTQATVRETFTNSKGINYGVYGSYSPIDGLRFDAVLTNLNMVLNHQRYDAASNQTAYAKYKMNTLIGDVMASYTWKLPRDYSVRFNVGNTYVGNHADGFTESGASVNFIQKSSTLKIHEVYGGLGLRKGWMVDKLLWRLTGSYEIGRQYYHKGRPIEVSYLGGTPITITNGPLRLNHYLNANLSVLQEAIGLKGVLAYTATLSPKAKTQGKSIRQMVSVKCELRF